MASRAWTHSSSLPSKCQMGAPLAMALTILSCPTITMECPIKCRIIRWVILMRLRAVSKICRRGRLILISSLRCWVETQIIRIGGLFRLRISSYRIPLLKARRYDQKSIWSCRWGKMKMILKIGPLFSTWVSMPWRSSTILELYSFRFRRKCSMS